MAQRSKFVIPSLSEMEKGTEAPAQPAQGKSLFQAHKVSSKNHPETRTESATSSSSLCSTSSNTYSSTKSQSVTNPLQTTIRATSSSVRIVPTKNASHPVPQSADSTPEVPNKIPDATDTADNSSATRVPSAASLIVSPRQRGNPILKYVRTVPWEYGDIVPDYVMGPSTCALYLSLRYHALNPNYVHERLKKLGHSYELRVLLVSIDVKDPHHALKELAKMCILADCTLILAWSAEDAGRYLETYKAFENKPPDMIMEKTDENYLVRLTDCFTSTRKVNKTDVATLLSTFECLENVINATEDDLGLCPGFGPHKAKRLHSFFHEPFLKPKKKKPEEASSEKSTSKPATVSTTEET